jgi:plasmid stabilization system protein ParE
LKVTYTEDAVADLVEAISYLNDRNPTAAANLDTELSRCIDRLAAHEFDGPVSRFIWRRREKLGGAALPHLLPAPL